MNDTRVGRLKGIVKTKRPQWDGTLECGHHFYSETLLRCDEYVLCRACPRSSGGKLIRSVVKTPIRLLR